MSRRPTSGDLGLSLVELLVVLSLTMVLLSLSGGLMGNIFTMSRRVEVTATLSNLRSQFIKVLTEDNAWDETINDASINSGMNCLLTATPDCTPTTVMTEFTPFARIGRGEPAALPAFGYDPSSATEGFNVDGSPCTSFDTGTPDVNCPIRLEFRWRPVCGVSCAQPEVLVQMSFIFAFPAGSVYQNLDPAKYSFTLTRAGAFQETVPINCVGTSFVNGADSSGVRTCNTFTY